MAKQRHQKSPPATRSPADPALPAFLSGDRDGCRVRVHVLPRAKTTTVAGTHGERLRIRVTAPPVDGAANRLCVQVLAAALGVPQASVTLLRGARGRDKEFGVRDVSPEMAAAALAKEQ